MAMLPWPSFQFIISILFHSPMVKKCLMHKQ